MAHGARQTPTDRNYAMSNVLTHILFTRSSAPVSCRANVSKAARGATGICRAAVCRIHVPKRRSVYKAMALCIMPRSVRGIVANILLAQPDFSDIPASNTVVCIRNAYDCTFIFFFFKCVCVLKQQVH